MIALTSYLYVGSEQDCRDVNGIPEGRADWYIVHACKDPCHRRLLGYTGRGAPKEHPEYLFAPRGSDLYVNFVDAPSADFFASEAVNAILNFYYHHRTKGHKILIHCNRGESRAPGLALLCLAQKWEMPLQLDAALAWLKQCVPTLNLGTGVRGMLEREWPL